MALNYEFTNCRDKKISDDECRNICGWMLVCGIRDITPESVKVFQKRITLHAAFDGGEVPSVKSLMRFNGLTTNISSMTGSQFLKRFAKDLDVPKKKKALV